jgi:hypothetical protein
MLAKKVFVGLKSEKQARNLRVLVDFKRNKEVVVFASSCVFFGTFVSEKTLHCYFQFSMFDDER